MAETFKIGDIVALRSDIERDYPIRKIRIGCVYSSGMMSGRFLGMRTGEPDGTQVTKLWPADVIKLDA